LAATGLDGPSSERAMDGIAFGETAWEDR